MSKKQYIAGFILTILYIALLAEPLHASQCRSMTVEQERAVQMAYVVGSPVDLGYTLAAITIQESFVGDYIVKANPKDGEHGSYGLTHVLLSTAMWLEGEESIWKAKQDILPKLLTDDLYAFKMSLMKLNTYKGDDWKGRVKAYNGRGALAEKYYKNIVKHVKMLKNCMNLEDG